MTTPGVERFALAFPADERIRAILRGFATSAALPIIVPGSVVEPCDDCGMALAVGPYIQGVRAGCALQGDPLILVCPWCAFRRGATGNNVAIVNLGNPDSRPE